MAKPDQDDSSAQGLQTKPGSTMEELRAARDALYADMAKEPTVPIPWAVHQLLDKLNRMLNGQAPVEQRPGNEMVTAVGAPSELSIEQRVISMLVQNVGSTIKYEQVYRAFQASDRKEVRDVWKKLNRGELEIPKDGNVGYTVFPRNKLEVIVTPYNTQIKTPEARKPKRNTERALLFLYENPGAPDNIVAEYVGAKGWRMKSILTRLANKGYIDINTRNLTEAGKQTAAALAELKPMNNAKRRRRKSTAPLALHARMRSYLAANSGKDIGPEDAMAYFSGDAPDAVRKYFGSFRDGILRLLGYTITALDESRIHVQRTKPAAANNGAIPVQPAPDYGNNSVVYLPEVFSINQIYEEDPELKDLVGTFTGMEPNLLAARQATRPEKIGQFYETVIKIPTEGIYMGRGHNDFFRLAVRNRTGAEQFMSWALQQEKLTSEMVYAELGKYETALARQP
ncbi:MAG: hypothetical protein HY515_01850 [Candidatus Aenigmarchaeota archaeon]|nr:hypothetical protein [Candidatus Aenigmarchaeota archaeon]